MQIDSTETTEKRANPRAQYFLVRKSDNYVPVFAFRSESDSSAIAAVVTDLSESGVQILSATTTALNSERYKLTLMVDPQKDAASSQSYEVTKIWSRHEGLHVLSGFSFGANSQPGSELAAQISASEYQLIRCNLHSLN